MVALGAFILLFGWFGFNAGSALAADGLAAHAFVTTAVSSAAAMLSWMFCDVVVNKKPTFVGACTGMVAGLVGITPGAGFVPIWAALIIGLTTSPICFFMISWVKEKFGYDDALDAFGCHGKRNFRKRRLNLRWHIMRRITQKRFCFRWCAEADWMGCVA